MRKGICLLIVLFGLFILIGTAGAIDTGSISLARFIARICVLVPVMIGAVWYGRLYRGEE